MFVRITVTSFLLLMLALQPATACEQTAATARCVPTGEWQFNMAIGAGYRSNPLHGGRNWPLWLMPDVSYYGERWFFDNGTVGYTLDPASDLQLSLVSRLNEEAGYFRRGSPANILQRQGIANIDGPQEKFLFASELQINQLEKRPLALDAGLQLNWQGLGFQWQANWWHDISDQYHGQHLRFGAAYGFETRTGIWQLSAALAWKDQDLMNTYYGISAAENDEQSWRVSASWQPEVALQWQYPLNDRWSVLSLLRYRWLDDRATSTAASSRSQNPMMQEDNIRHWFVGLNYRFF